LLNRSKLMSEKVSSTPSAADASQPFYLTRDRIPQIPADPALMKIQALGKKIAAVPSDLPEPSLSDNAWYIGRTRYAMRDEAGEPKESSREMFWRIAYNIATADRYYL